MRIAEETTIELEAKWRRGDRMACRLKRFALWFWMV
jgi:hypothetical protein